MWMWLLVGVTAWLLVPLPLAVLIGRLLRGPVLVVPSDVSSLTGPIGPDAPTRRVPAGRVLADLVDGRRGSPSPWGW